MNDLTTNIIPSDNSHNTVLIKLIETAGEHPYAAITITAMMACTVLAITAINAKYHRETTMSSNEDNGFKYVSKPSTPNDLNTNSCSM